MRTSNYARLACMVVIGASAWTTALASTAGNPPVASASPYSCEGEFYSSKINGRYSVPAYDYKPTASNKNTIHLGSSSSSIHYGVGDSVIYTINFKRSFSAAQLSFRYADAVPGNVLQVYLDGYVYGTVTTQNTGGWGSFVWHPTVIPLGNIGVGTHTVMFTVTTGGSYGMNLDVFKITGN